MKTLNCIQIKQVNGGGIGLASLQGAALIAGGTAIGFGVGQGIIKYQMNNMINEVHNFGDLFGLLFLMDVVLTTSTLVGAGMGIGAAGFNLAKAIG